MVLPHLLDNSLNLCLLDVVEIPLPDGPAVINEMQPVYDEDEGKSTDSVAEMKSETQGIFGLESRST
jgi:hypothetical protein